MISLWAWVEPSDVAAYAASLLLPAYVSHLRLAPLTFASQAPNRDGREPLVLTYVGEGRLEEYRLDPKEHALGLIRLVAPGVVDARVNGKPILYFWRQQVRSVDEWAEIRNAVDPQHDQIWIAEGVNIAYQRVFDGHHLYSIAWSPDVDYTLNDWSRRVRRAGAEKLWVATVMPGYDDTRTTRPDKFARNREGGNFFRATWNAALATKPDLLIINSWNEWVEGSMIEPSVTYGNLYLDITREYAAQLKTQLPLSSEEKILAAATNTPRPTHEPTAIPTSAPTRGPTPTPSPTPIEFAAYRTTEILRVRSGPGTQYDVIDKVPSNFVLDVLGRSQDKKWLAIAYPDFGSLGWVSAEFVTPQNGFEQFPVEPAHREQVPSPAPTPSTQIETPDPVPNWY
jgi:hypothetical protein